MGQEMRPKYVFFDLETTGLNHEELELGVGIVQIGATTDQDECFEIIINPRERISGRATQIHGFYQDRGGYLCNAEFGVVADKIYSPKQGLIAFVNYLEGMCYEDEYVVLVAHNCFGFDSLVLCHQLQKNSVRVPWVLWQGQFADSVEAVRPLLNPAARPMTRDRYGCSLNNSMLSLLGYPQSGLHDAYADAEAARDVTFAAWDWRRRCRDLYDVLGGFRCHVDLQATWKTCKDARRYYYQQNY